MKEINISIDILKFIAVLLVVNSHMDGLYPNPKFATGGAIGDVLFFFCSGYTLSLKTFHSFTSYYKKRINRIYPSIIAWVFLRTLFFDYHGDIIDIILFGGGWFISCIMIYYILLFFIQKYCHEHIKIVFLIFCCITLIWYYFFFDHKEIVWMYKATLFKWCHYFLFMLLGAACANKFKEAPPFTNNTLYSDISLLLLSIASFYGILMLGENSPAFAYYQITSLIPLLGITFYTFRISQSTKVAALYQNRILHPVITVIGGLCLEFYLVQGALMKTSINIPFPLNAITAFVSIFLLAYIVRCLSRIIKQTFLDRENYDWKEVFRF